MSEISESGSAGAESGQNDVAQSQEQQAQSPQGQSQAKPQTAAQAAKNNKRSFELKVNNELKKLDLDMDNQEELTKYLQKAVAFDSKAQEAASMRKQMEELGEYLNQAKSDKGTLRKLLKDLGADERELAQMIMEEELERAKKSPEQLEREKILAELDQERKAKQALEQEKLTLERERRLSEEVEKIDQEMGQALEANSIPKNPYFIKRLAEYGMVATESGIDIPMRDLVPLVMKEIKEDIRQLMDLSDDNLVEEILSKDRIANIRKKHLAQARQSQQSFSNPAIRDVGATPASADNSKKDKISLKKFLYG